MKRFCGYIEEHGTRKYPLEMELPDDATGAVAAEEYKSRRGIISSVHPIRAELVSDEVALPEQHPAAAPEAQSQMPPALAVPRKVRTLKAPPRQE